MNINQLINMKQQGEKIAMVTCYDHATATIVNQSDIDMILVGDSAAMVMHGESSTLPIDTETMALHTRSVVKGAPNKFIVADMPFMSYRKSLDSNMTAVEILMKTGAHAIKLEGVTGNETLIEHVVQSGVPVMGHLGLTPQSIYKFGTYTVRAKEEEEAEKLKKDALLLQKLGCFALVLEKVPAKLAKEVAESLTIPVIGIGAGNGVDGQVLVTHDMVGMTHEFNPRFLRRYMNLYEDMTSAIEQYCTDVKSVDFPNEEEQY